VPLAQALTDFKACVAQCDNLIASAHRADAIGVPIFALIERQQITAVSFLNMFIGWETFLESSLLHLMAGYPTIGGTLPTRRVSPLTTDDARNMVKGAGRQYFDYTNHGNVQITVRMYFDQGYPYEPHISSIYQDLSDLKTIRNSCAHVTAATQIPLRTLAFRIAGQPVPDLTVYKLLTMTDPRPGSMGTVLESYKSKLLVTAELIAHG
jgi:hypothetical protein